MNIIIVLNGNQMEFAAEKDRKKNKIIGINAQRKDVSIHEDKIFSQFKAHSTTIDEVLEELRNLETQKKTLKNEISLKEIYELVQTEKNGMPLEDIFSLCFNEHETIKKIALYEKILEDRIFFRHKNNLFIPKENQEVEETLKQIEIQKQKQAKKDFEEEQVFSWLKENFSNKERKAAPDYVANYLNIIKNYCVFGEDFSKKNQAIELLKRISDETGFSIEGNLAYAAFKFLKEVKLVEEDENLLLKKYSVSLHFNEQEINESNEIEKKFKINLDHRKDYRDLITFSIDDQDTKDIDDAFSLIENDNGYRFFIHIADVAQIVSKGSLLDQTASKRTSSIYLPDIKIPMLPQNISENLCSLIENQERYALSFIVDTDKEFNIQSSMIEESVVRLNKNMSYDEVDNILLNTNHDQFQILNILYQFAQKFQSKRLNEWKGIDFLFPSVYPKINGQEIKLRTYNPLSKSNLLVKEFMVLANWISADFCQKKSMPAIYICQDSPDNFFELENRAVSDKILLQEFVKFMKKSYFSLHSSKHFALGLTSYTQSTSPIRRFLDLLIQRQIKKYLNEEKADYTEEEIQEFKAGIELQKPVISNIEDESNKYWLLKYLLIHFRNKPLDALILKELPDGYLVEIEKTMTSAKIITKNELKIGEKIKVKVHTILPRLGVTLGNF